MLQDSGLDDLEKLQTALHLYFPGVVFDYDVLDEALGKLVWFYRCGTDPAETTEEDATDSSDKDPPFSYEYDADYIYSAFMQAYGLPSTGGSFERFFDRSLKRLSWSKSSATAR